MNNEMSFTVVDDEGNEIICDVISFYHYEAKDEMYVLYTDYTLNDSSKFNTYLSQLVETNGTYKLELVNNKQKYSEIANSAKTLYGKPLAELA